ncbi:MAG: DEAD/DEAH box helicase [Anaerolineales bacterium]
MVSQVQVKQKFISRAAEEVVKRGKQVIVLVPEIALTPQTVQRFLNRFPGQVGLVHSRLSEGERYDTWRRARAGKLKVIIGARSALFAPLPNIGLIVADECHDSSFHQAEPPFYHAVTAAQTYARLCGAVCVMGSATPTIEQRFRSNSSPFRRGSVSRSCSPNVSSDQDYLRPHREHARRTQSGSTRDLQSASAS